MIFSMKQEYYFNATTLRGIIAAYLKEVFQKR